MPYPAYGPDTREGIAAMNRPLFVNLLGTEWLPAVPDVHARLQADPPARLGEQVDPVEDGTTTEGDREVTDDDRGEGGGAGC